jgi:hypothetical protein
MPGQEMKEGFREISMGPLVGAGGASGVFTWIVELLMKNKGSRAGACDCS